MLICLIPWAQCATVGRGVGGWGDVVSVCMAQGSESQGFHRVGDLNRSDFREQGFQRAGDLNRRDFRELIASQEALNTSQDPDRGLGAQSPPKPS